MRVVKFGGTSLCQLDRVIEIVGQYKNNVCVVVSALNDTTNLLRKKNIHQIRLQYLKWANGLNIDAMLHLYWDHVESVCNCKCANKKQQNDLILSYGERCSAIIISRAIEMYVGKQSCVFDSIGVTGVHGNAKIVEIAIDPNLLKNNIVVVPGFYGYDVTTKRIKTIGESGSDITASAIGSLINAKEIIIYTDVKGIFNADPRKVKNAKILKTIHPRDVVELGYAGGNVLHPRTVLMLVDTPIDLWVRDLFGKEGEGTKVSKDAKDNLPCLAVALKNDQILVTVETQHIAGIPGIASKLFSTLANEGISVSLITQSCSECSISFTINEKFVSALDKINNIIDLKKVGIVTLIGSNMRSQVGIAAAFFQSLSENNINVIAISQGSTERSLSAVVSRENSLESLRCVHSII